MSKIITSEDVTPCTAPSLACIAELCAFLESARIALHPQGMTYSPVQHARAIRAALIPTLLHRTGLVIWLPPSSQYKRANSLIQHILNPSPALHMPGKIMQSFEKAVDAFVDEVANSEGPKLLPTVPRSTRRYDAPVKYVHPITATLSAPELTAGGSLPAIW